jgi:hypothetical protein
MKQLKQATVEAVCSQDCTPRSAAVDFLLDIIADAVVDCSRDTMDAVVGVTGVVVAACWRD